MVRNILDHTSKHDQDTKAKLVAKIIDKEGKEFGQKIKQQQSEMIQATIQLTSSQTNTLMTLLSMFLFWYIRCDSDDLVALCLVANNRIRKEANSSFMRSQISVVSSQMEPHYPADVVQLFGIHLHGPSGADKLLMALRQFWCWSCPKRGQDV